jgi:hypothetical protein
MGLRHVDPYERRGRLYLAIARFATIRLGVWLSTNISWNLDPLLLKLTRGRFSTAWPLATGVLETRGGPSPGMWWMRTSPRDPCWTLCRDGGGGHLLAWSGCGRFGRRPG